MARRGSDIELPDDLVEDVRLHDLIELTHWSLAEIAAAPAAVIDRLLRVREADIRARAMSERESVDAIAGMMKPRR